jgi:hypothetical protein
MLALAADAGKHAAIIAHEEIETAGQLAFSPIPPKIFGMPERVQKPPVPWGPKPGGEGDGPRSPDISRPDTKELLKKMRKVDPNQSKRYRQRTGQ